jgi:hypothetical protein
MNVEAAYYPYILKFGVVAMKMRSDSGAFSEGTGSKIQMAY